MESKGVQYIEIDSEYEGQRLDNFLLRELKGVPRTLVYRLLRTDEVRVNKKRVKPKQRLVTGDIVRVAPIRMSPNKVFGDEANAEAKAHWTALEANVLLETGQLLILNKPNGWAVHGGSGIQMGIIETVRAGRPDCKFLELVHRLDRDTSGCLIIAKKRSVLVELHELIRTGKIRKRYQALVDGYWPESLQRIEAPLLKNQLKSGERMVVVHPEGKESTTLVNVLRRYKTKINDTNNAEQPQNQELTLIDIELITGRTHQIRVHCKHSGYPVVGDEKYGISEHQKQHKALGLNRLFLHAYQLQFKLPNQAAISVEAPLANNFDEPVSKLTIAS